MSQRSPWTIPLCLAVLLLGPLSAPGQELRKAGDDSPAAQSTPDDVHVAPVVVDGETLFSVRGVTAVLSEFENPSPSEAVAALHARVGEFADNGMLTDDLCMLAARID